MPNQSRRDFFKGAAALAAMPLVASETNIQSKTLKLVHITDAHMDLGAPDSVEALKMAVKYLNKHYPYLDCVLFGGDNFNNNMAGDKDALIYKEITEKLHCPVYHVRGNKESSPVNDNYIHLKEFKKLFMSQKELRVEGRDWAVEKNGYLILGLDSTIENANNGRYGKETITFAKKMLEQGKPTLILNHHPYTNYWCGTDKKDIHKYVLGNTEEVIKTLFEYPNLIATLSGHKHIDNLKLINHVRVITTRGFIRPLDLDEYPMRYIELNGNQLSEKLIYTHEG
ncbi:MAG: metallophosphoesterase [Sulfurovum sp.]|nr:metallophosphoesterase [Sulfurovum sp.]MCB4760157.1 metallophosphoesterase [Sulfurovum sp.]